MARRPVAGSERVRFRVRFAPTGRHPERFAGCVGYRGALGTREYAVLLRYDDAPCQVTSMPAIELSQKERKGQATLIPVPQPDTES